MCGIAGFIGHKNLGKSDIKTTAKAMAAAMAHRGPDDEGVWSDGRDEVTLVHRRLAVIDLSPKGHQPMQSASGRYWLVFNGEIYNHLDLRARLEKEGARWRGTSDTETLLAAIDAWGLQKALTQSTGMFAFALWDCHKKTLALARDRMGEKPLYYGEQGGVFLFGSELKPLTKHPAFNAFINRNAMARLMQYYYIPAPMSIYEGIKKLEPGRILTISRKRGGYEYKETAYWSLADAVNSGAANPLADNEGTIIDNIETLLRDAVAKQMIADVPVGAFLSGGIDSSLVVALMQAASSRAVNTYSIGFDVGGGFTDEAPYAKAVAKHLKTNHTELYVSAKDALTIIPEIPKIYDEPFADSSQIPTVILSRMTRRHVTVALSGDGGDELFGGYDHYPYAIKMHRLLMGIPKPLRHIIAGTSRLVPWGAIDACGGHAIDRIIGRGEARGLPYKADKLVRMLRAPGGVAFYTTARKQWLNTDALIPGSNMDSTALDMPGIGTGLTFTCAMLAADMATYLPDDILVKVDRAAMSTSLETRIPMLDHAVVEYAQRLPDHLKIREGYKKYILKKLLYRHVPRELIDRPKMGFGAPVGIWLRGDLRSWAEDLLAPAKIREGGFFNEKLVTRTWEEFITGKRDWAMQLWNVLMFQAWLEGR